VVLGGVPGPLALIVLGVLLPAWMAGVLRPLLRAVVVLALPIAVSVVVINVLFFPAGREILVQVGPIRVTVEGVTFATAILVRILAIAGAITLFYLTTTPGELTVDLERRGVPARLAFVASASVQTVPAMLDRAVAITAAQRARGLDTEGSVGARVRGIVPIVGPVILGAIAEVEERTMALEARGFSRPGRRTLLWHPPDSPRQGVGRWLMVLAIPAVIAGRAFGWIP
jgi:energy-coupling factor transport system permease protein